MKREIATVFIIFRKLIRLGRHDLILPGFAFLLVYSACIPHSDAAEPGDRAQAKGLSRTSEMRAGAEREPLLELASTTPSGNAAESATKMGESPGEEEGFERHNLNLLLRYMFEGDESGLATGLEYEYRFRRGIGIGGMAEYVGGDIGASVLGVMAYFHPWRELVLMIGPGVEFDSAEHDSFIRVGALYEFEVGSVYVGPAVIVDTFRGKEHAYIVGGQVGVKF